MDIHDVSLPEIYTSSEDFRFFVEWFNVALSKIQYDTEHFFDLYDCLRCPSSMLWLLGDTMGYKYDDRLPAAYNRMVMMYFMNMIRLKGSQDGLLLAAEVNLSQFNVLDSGKENSVLYDRLEDTSLPVNSAYVNAHVDEGYIDVVYFSTEKPVDACTEYVRPLGMYMFEYAGAKYDARTKLSVDARLTNLVETQEYATLGYTDDVNPTQFLKSTSVAHYSREDYARLQKGMGRYKDSNGDIVGGFDPSHTRRNIWYRNSISEENTTVINPQHQTEASSAAINPGYRALYSLQLCNNDHIIRALIRSAENPDETIELDPIFSIPVSSVSVTPPPAVIRGTDLDVGWNLKYDKDLDESYTYHQDSNYDVYTTETRPSGTTVPPYTTPAVNPSMFTIGEAISTSPDNSTYYPDKPGTQT